MRPRRRSILFFCALGVVGVLVLLFAALVLMDWDLLRGPVARLASAKSGRTVSIAGHLRVQLWSRTPTLTVEGLQVANPPWELQRPLLQLERLQVQIELGPLIGGHLVLKRVEVIAPDLYLHQERSGRANWTNADTAPTSATQAASKPFKLPTLHELIIESGRVVMIDDARRLKISGTIQAHEHSAAQGPEALHVEGHGTINNQPFSLDISGGALLAVDPGHPYPFKLSIKAAENQIQAEGQVLKPFDLGQLELEVAARGPDLAELFYLTQLALPNTPPYQLHAHISRDGQHFAVEGIRGRLGRSDIAGRLQVDASNNRPRVTAVLSSDHLYLADLGALTGSRVAGAGALDQQNPGASPPVAAADTVGPRMLFPDARLATNRVRAMDGDVQFKATSIEAGKVPITEVDLHAQLQDGVLVLDPLKLAMPEGHLSGRVRIDAREAVPSVRIDIRATDIQLDQFKGSGKQPEAPVGGLMQARVLISGQGDSLHALMAHADGSLAAVIPHGDIRSAFAELTGIDLAGVGLLLTHDQGRAAIRCGVARFDLTGGTATAQSIVLDTQNVLITGGGTVNLQSEKLNLTLQGRPKKFHLVRVRAPVTIKGQLTKPSFSADKGKLLKQGGIAAALATLLTPVAAMLAFVDPGLAKDQDCSQLLAQAP